MANETKVSPEKVGDKGRTNAPIGQRVLVTRREGDQHIARRDKKRDTIFRDPDSVQWLNDDDKFIDVHLNPVVSWEPLPPP